MATNYAILNKVSGVNSGFKNLFIRKYAVLPYVITYMKAKIYLSVLEREQANQKHKHFS